MKDWQDNKAVQFESEFTSYITRAQLSVLVHNSAILRATKLITGSRTEHKEFFADFQKNN